MSKKKQFSIEVKYVFSGKFTVKADSLMDAVMIVKNDCGLVLGRGIHTNANDDVVDWDFDTHPETEITTTD